MSNTASGTTLNFLKVTAEELTHLLNSGKLNSVDLTGAYFSRIQRDNLEGATIRAIIQTAPVDELLQLARQLDEERKRGKLRSPLHGIPIVLKDNITTTGSLRTASGSHALAGSIVTEESTIARKLREAGLLILGKANMSEWCNYRSAGKIPNGWSGLGGQGLSPYCFSADPLGSSSGSAAAVAAGFAPLAVGSETDGSLICPASRMANYTLKPSVGLVSRGGMIPVSVHQDSSGPMGKCVKDVAMLLNVMVGPDDRDEASMQAASHIDRDYTRFLVKKFTGLKFGVLSPWYFQAKDNIRGGDGAVEILEKTKWALEQMTLAGADISNPVELETMQEILDFDPGSVQNFDFKFGLEKYLATLSNTNIRTLADVIQYNQEHPETETKPGYEAQDLFEECVKCNESDADIHATQLKRQHKLSRDDGIDATLAKHGVNILIVPSETSKGTRPAAMTGYPIANVPLGVLENGEPFGLAFFAGRFQEGLLLQAMSAFETLCPRPLPSYFVDGANWPECKV